MIKNFSNELFPQELAYLVSGGAEFSTTIHSCENGLESRIFARKIPQFRYYISHEIMTPSERELLSNFFITHMGRAVAFRFRDMSDNYAECTQEVINGRGFLHKKYTIGELSIRRRITLPYNCKFFAGGIETYATVDALTGEFTVASDAQNITAQFNFDVPVRFDTDSLILSNEYKSQVEISLIEVRMS